MNIFYDNIIYSLQRAGGISTYWSELILRFLRDKENIVFSEYEHANIVREAVPIPKTSIISSQNMSIQIQRFKSLKKQFDGEDYIFHSSYNRISRDLHAKQVLTVHDFVHEKFYSGARRFLHLYQKNKAINVARRIIAVSENTKRDLLEFNPHLKEENVSVIYNGVSDDFFPMVNEQQLLPTEMPFIIFIGSRVKYKNFNFAVDVLKRLPDFKLVIVGAALTPVEQQQLNNKLGGRWESFIHVENAFLNHLYNKAYALLYPSSYEGFGIPLLEVMKAGTPFIALNKSSIPEVAGNAGVLIDELDVDSFVTAVYNISNDRAGLVEKGFIQSTKFSWETCYRQTKSVYKELLEA
jgi:mannosyltransferase